jgi:hypothetical protein
MGRNGRITHWRFKAEELRMLSEVMRAQAAKDGMRLAADSLTRMADREDAQLAERSPHFPDFDPPDP